MARKFSELSQSEQIHFKGLVDFMKETWNEDIEAKLNIIKKFKLDIKDPIVLDFLTDIYIPAEQNTQAAQEQLRAEATEFANKMSEHMYPQETAPASTNQGHTPTAPYPPPHHPPAVPTSQYDNSVAYRDYTSPVSISVPIAELFQSAPPNTQTYPLKQAKQKELRQMSYANSEDLIIIQNRLLHAISHLTLNERRLILFLSPIVRKARENSNASSFVVRAVDFADEYGIKREKSYQVLEQTADTILEKAFWFWNFKDNNPFGKKTHKTGLSWVTRCDYIKTKGELVVELHNSVIEMLTIFDGNTGNFWTQYQKEWVVNLGTYGIIMLELVLSSFERDVKGHYTVEHLREKFDCIDSYEKFSNFRIWVIDKAIQEIHKNTPIKIKYKTHKTGRSVTALSFSYINTSKPVKKLKEKTKNSDNKPKEENPFVNFKMTQKQLSMFAGKIKKATGQDIDEIIAELCNVHLQGKHTDFLKVLDYVPSDWYSDDEIKSHLNNKQIAKAKADAKAQEREDKKQRQQQLKEDMAKIMDNAQIFVEANLARVSKTGIERLYLEQGNYAGIVRSWEHYLLDESTRKHFSLIDEILGV